MTDPGAPTPDAFHRDPMAAQDSPLDPESLAAFVNQMYAESSGGPKVSRSMQPGWYASSRRRLASWLIVQSARVPQEAAS